MPKSTQSEEVRIALTKPQQETLDLIWAGDNAHLHGDHWDRYEYPMLEGASSHSLYDASVSISVRALVRNGLVSHRRFNESGERFFEALPEAERYVSAEAKQRHDRNVLFVQKLVKAKAWFKDTLNKERMPKTFSLMSTYASRSRFTATVKREHTDSGLLTSSVIVLHYNTLKISLCDLSPFEPIDHRSSHHAYLGNVAALVMFVLDCDVSLHETLFGEEDNPYLKGQEQ